MTMHNDAPTVAAPLSTITPAEAGGLVVAQTEARAIARRLKYVTIDSDTAIDIIATALAAKDAELDGAVFLKDAAEAALRKREVEINKLHAQLAEARKALEQIAEGRPDNPVGDPWAFYDDLVGVARRALEGGQEDG